MANTDCKEQLSFGLFWPTVDDGAPDNAKRLTDEATGDTDQDVALTMHPPLDGEDLDAAVLDRNPENIRARLELLRDEMETRRYERDYCRAYLLESSGTLQWNGTVADGSDGKFSITVDLYVRPFMAPNVSSIAQMSIDDGGGNILYVQTNAAAVGAPPTTGDPPRAYSGANKISVEVLGVVGGPLGITVDGDPADNVHITVDTTPLIGTNYAALEAFLNAQPAFTNLGLFAIQDAGCDPAAIVQGQDTLRLRGARDAEVHVITPAGLAAFFAADPANCLADGDVLALWYDKTNDHPTSPGGKRQSIDDAAAEQSANADGNLVNLTREPWKMYGAVPIARVVGTELQLVTGERISRSVPTLPNHAYVRRAGDTMTGCLWVDVTAAGTNDTAINATGNGTGAGVTATGGDDSGPGVSAQGGAADGDGVFANANGNGRGVYGHGGGTGAGVYGEGSAAGSQGVYGLGGGNTGDGVSGIGGAVSGRGVVGQGVGVSVGVYGQGGVTDATGVYGAGGAGGNGRGVHGAGTGTAEGVYGAGGPTSGTGVSGVGGAPDGIGVVGTGDGTGAGVSGTGGHGGGVGVTGLGVGAGDGVTGTGGATDGRGVVGTGTAAGDGVSGTGGATGRGVYGYGGATSGHGVEGVAQTLGYGLKGTGAGACAGVHGTPGNVAANAGVYGTDVVGGQYGVHGDVTGAASVGVRGYCDDDGLAGVEAQCAAGALSLRCVGGPMLFPVLAADPVAPAPAEGFAYVNSTTHKLRVYIGGIWVDQS